MKPGDQVEVSVSHVGGAAGWIDARVVSVDEARGLVWVKAAAALFAVTAANVRLRGDV
jgi:hypothetical protein